MRLETQWHGLERLTYYVLFPMLLIQTLVKADLSKVPVAGVGGALLLSALAMSLLCLALRPIFSRWDINGPAFTSIFQGATRWPARFLKREQDLGTLAPGRYADIIAVRGDVLHDIELLQHVDLVIKGGVRVR